MGLTRRVALDGRHHRGTTSLHGSTGLADFSITVPLHRVRSPNRTHTFGSTRTNVQRVVLGFVAGVALMGLPKIGAFVGFVAGTVVGLEGGAVVAAGRCVAAGAGVKKTDPGLVAGAVTGLAAGAVTVGLAAGADVRTGGVGVGGSTGATRRGRTGCSTGAAARAGACGCSGTVGRSCAGIGVGKLTVAVGLAGALVGGNVGASVGKGVGVGSGSGVGSTMTTG